MANRGTSVLGLTLLLVVAGCVPSGGAGGPIDPGDLTVIGSADGTQVLVSASVALSASAEGGTPPYAYRWDQNAGPIEVAVAPPTATDLAVGPLNEAGRYVFRVVVTDQAGRSVQDFVVVTVGEGAGVSLEANLTDVVEGNPVTLTATTTEGEAPFTFAWSLADGPIVLDLSAADGDTLTTEPLTAPGDYTFRVTVTEGRGFSASDAVTVLVSSIVTVDTPKLALAGVPASLSVTVDTEVTDVTYEWAVISGDAAFDTPTAAETNITTASDETVLVSLSVTLDGGSGLPVTLRRDVEVVSVTTTTPRVLVETKFGDFILELDGVAAPGHTGNMLAYVDDGFYEGLLFHRNACSENAGTGECDPFVLQGGGYERVDGELVEREPTRARIESEAGNGLSAGEVYSISLALLGGNPNSGATQFFINLRDNSFLDAQGFTVFGRVVEGTGVVDTIVAQERTESSILSGEVSQPVEDVIIEQMSRVAPP